MIGEVNQGLPSRLLHAGLLQSFLRSSLMGRASLAHSINGRVLSYLEGTIGVVEVLMG